MNDLIGVNSLTKVYHNGRENVHAVHNVSFTLSAQDYVAIIGPSGAGKSTLLHIVGGLETPTSGQVTFKGEDIYQMKEKHLAHWRNATVGFVFQFYHLIEELNVLENVALAAYLAKRKSSLKRAQELLEYLGIEERRNFFPSQLSGGEKQKTAIARALINNPEVILCDEPTGNLDVDSANKVMHLLEELNREKKKTIILITHNLELAKRAKRVIHIKAGAIVNN